LKIRLGAVPDTEVKIPQAPPGKAAHPLCASVRWSSQYGKIRYVRVVSGRQVFVKIETGLTNWKVPLESTFAAV